MRKLKVSRFLQDPAHCAVATAAVLANFQNPKMTYETSKEIAHKMFPNVSEGLTSAETGMLLNKLGFKEVTIISSDLNYLDYSWIVYGKRKIINILKTAAKKNKDYRVVLKLLAKFLANKEFDNKLIINYHFSKYIKEAIDSGIPVGANFNWTMFFEFSKIDPDNSKNPFCGQQEEHEVVIYGYSKKNVFLVDSHHKYYKYNLKKYRIGRYSIPWNEFMTVMGTGDIIIAKNYELV